MLSSVVQQQSIWAAACALCLCPLLVPFASALLFVPSACALCLLVMLRPEIPHHVSKCCACNDSSYLLASNNVLLEPCYHQQLMQSCD